MGSVETSGRTAVQRWRFGPRLASSASLAYRRHPGPRTTTRPGRSGPDTFSKLVSIFTGLVRRVSEAAILTPNEKCATVTFR